MAAAAAQSEIQTLLRFLTQDAKLPLSDALPKIGLLRKQNLNSTADIVKADSDVLKLVFQDDKTVKQVRNAAKRVTSPKKRGASDIPTASRVKRVKLDDDEAGTHDEDRLLLPVSTLPLHALSDVEIETNRAPLVLAFAVSVLKYTMPEQPVSSRLSLSQALVSANSQSKAKSVGLLSGKTADDEGWAEGQPKLKVLGREIAVLRRHKPPMGDEHQSQKPDALTTTHDTFWGLDLEALRKSNGPLVAGKLSGSAGPPIHTPDAARGYLLKAMSMAPQVQEGDVTSTKKRSSTQVAKMKEDALSMLLQAIDALCESWASVLSKHELDSRAWSWYIKVRPDVAQGQAGWGQRGKVRLQDILDLRRE